MEDEIHHSELAKLTGYNERTFRDAAAAGWINAPRRGVYDTKNFFVGFIKYLRSLTEKKPRGLEEKKETKLDFENREAERREQYELGQTLTLREWEDQLGETLPPIMEAMHKVLTIEMPAQCVGMEQTQMQAWGKKKEAEMRRDLRDAEKTMAAPAVIKKRKVKGMPE